MTETYDLILAALWAMLLTIGLTPVAAAIARRFGIVDRPGGRRIHRRVTPRLGGLAVLSAFLITLGYFLPQLAPNFRPGQLAAFAVAAGLLLVAGVIDDRRGLRPGWQLASQVAAASILVGVGMGIPEAITNPLGGKLDLHLWQIPIPGFETGRFLQLPADLLTIAWVVLVINAINFLDGLDGLATGVGLISAAILAALSLSAAVDQPHVALLALTLAGSLFGFLLWNFHPARIFLGTVGSTFVGFTIATLAIISGGKIATALLVLAFPILDALAVIARRGRSRQAFWRADTTHLHHLLLARGYSVRQTVLLIYALSAAFGGLALLAGTTSLKALAFAGTVVLMLAVLAWATRATFKSSQN